MSEITHKISGRIAASASQKFNPWKSDIFPSSRGVVNKMGVPDEWHDVVNMAEFFYEREGLVRTVIDKQVEIAINGFSIIFPQGSPSYAEAFEYILPSIRDFLSMAATEYFLSGLVVSGILWDTISPLETGLSAEYILPTDLWVRNPLNIELKSTPVPSRVVPLWKIPKETIVFIKNKGKYSDGTVDKQTYDLLAEQFPLYIKRIRQGETTIPLNDAYLIRRKPVLRTQYPIPYLMPVLELLVHKRNLRKMDYAIASRMINAILHVKIGNDQFPVTVDDEYIIDDLRDEFRRRGSDNNYERIVEFFTNHTVDIQWITPDIDLLLNSVKYVELNQEILYGMGFPRFLITGEKERSNSGSSGSALLSPLNSMRSLRQDFEPLLNSIFREISLQNGFDVTPLVSFDPLNLVDLSDLIQISQAMYDKKIISGGSLAKLAGFDFIREQHIRDQEATLCTELFGDENEQENLHKQSD